MPDTVQVGSARAERGEKVWGELPVPEAQREALRPPWVVVVHGAADGPTVYIGSGTHGDELNSIEATRRTALELDPRSVHGTVILVPVHNRASFDARARRAPADDKDLDYCYPGREDGSPTEVLARVLFDGAITRADYALDLHTATRGGWNLAHALVAPHTPEAAERAQELAQVFGTRVIVRLERPAPGAHLGDAMGWDLDHNLFVQASARGIPSTIIEFGEGGRLEPDQVELGRRGIRNVLAHLGVLEARAEPQPAAFVAREARAIRCATQGLLHMAVRAGDRVGRGQLLARVVSFPDQVEEIRTDADGVVVRVSTDGVIARNDRVVVLAVT